MKPTLAVLIILFCSWLPGAMAATVTLPIEVLGENGATSSVTVQVPARSAREVKSMWMQIHNLSYPDIASVQINNSQWFTLNNDTVAVAEPGKSYGGIGGGFNTLKVTLALPAARSLKAPTPFVSASTAPMASQAVFEYWHLTFLQAIRQGF